MVESLGQLRDGRLLASIYDCINVWNINTNECLLTLFQACFSQLLGQSDDDRLISSSSNGFPVGT